jgi:hypothetical protein
MTGDQEGRRPAAFLLIMGKGKAAPSLAFCSLLFSFLFPSLSFSLCPRNRKSLQRRLPPPNPVVRTPGKKEERETERQSERDRERKRERQREREREREKERVREREKESVREREKERERD